MPAASSRWNSAAATAPRISRRRCLRHSENWSGAALLHLAPLAGRGRIASAQLKRRRGLTAPLSFSPAAPVAVAPAPRTRSVERAWTVKAIGAVKVRTPPTAAPGVTHPTNLIDIRGWPACDPIRLRNAIRHCRECLPRSKRHTAQGSQTKNSKFEFHRNLPLCWRKNIREISWLLRPGRRARNLIFLNAGSVSSPLELRLALLHEGLPALAKIRTVHASRADRLDRVHVAPAFVLQHLRDGDLGGLDRKRRILRDRFGDRHGLAPELIVGDQALDQSDTERLGAIDAHARVHQKPRPGRADQRHQVAQ